MLQIWRANMPNTPLPQGGVCRSRTPSLRQKASNWFWPKAFVMMSAIQVPVKTSFVAIVFRMNSSRMRWHSFTMCFVLAWKTGFSASWITERLSECKVMVAKKSIPKSDSNSRSQRSSQTVSPIAWYSTSADEQEKTSCLCVFEESGEPSELY